MTPIYIYVALGKDGVYICCPWMLDWSRTEGTSDESSLGSSVWLYLIRAWLRLYIGRLHCPAGFHTTRMDFVMQRLNVSAAVSAAV